jgi:hypothetical protein
MCLGLSGHQKSPASTFLPFVITATTIKHCNLQSVSKKQGAASTILHDSPYHCSLHPCYWLMSFAVFLLTRRLLRYFPPPSLGCARTVSRPGYRARIACITNRRFICTSLPNLSEISHHLCLDIRIPESAASIAYSRSQHDRTKCAGTSSHFAQIYITRTDSDRYTIKPSREATTEGTSSEPVAIEGKEPPDNGKMPSQRPYFLSSFLAAFRQQGPPTLQTSTQQPNKQPSTQSAAASTSYAQTTTQSSPRTISANGTAASSTSHTSHSTHHHHHHHGHHNPSASPVAIHSAKRRGSDSSSEGFRDVLGADKWYIGGKTATGEEQFFKLGVIRRVRSNDRLSLDRLSL